MSWDEFRTRLGQEFGKRAEYVVYRTGLQSKPRIGMPVHGQQSGFFFSREEIQSRIALLREHLPQVISETVEEADEILGHRFRLLGYRDLDYDQEIDWHLDVVHGKRAPLKPWYKIHFLDFNEVGDHKVTWELNRHQHLVTLAKASVFTGDKKYSDEIERQFYSWQKANPYPTGINWGSSLEVAFRSLSWIWVRQLAGKAISLEFDRDLMRGLARNGRYIERYLSTYFSPNTHLIGEALALFFIGTLCPEIPVAPKWRKKGLEILVAEIQRQVRADGVYFEQSLYYHVYALDMFLYARALASTNGIALQDSYDQILRRMLHVLATLCRNGPPPTFGDDDGGRLFNPRRNRAEHMADPLALGACIFNDMASADLTEEAIWLFGERAISHCRKEDKYLPPTSCEFEDGGLYVISSGGKQCSQMLIDAGPHGIGYGGHGHADALSLQLSINGKPWLVDPGAYVYVSPGDGRNQFRGTAAHNTVCVDHVDQAIPETPFSWSSLPQVSTEQWETGEQFTLFAGSHNGYQRLSDPVRHLRAIFHLHGEYWLVRDVLLGESEHDFEIFWHFGSGAKLTSHDGWLRAKLGNDELAILGAGKAMWNTSVEEGCVSPAYGEKQMAPVGAFRARQQLPTEHASLFVPVIASRNEPALKIGSVTESYTSYLYKDGVTEDQLIFAKADQKWTDDSLASDANFLFLRREAREITMLAFCGASFLDCAGQRVFSAPARTGRIEWTSAYGAAASDPQSLKFFHGELIRAGAPVR